MATNADVDLDTVRRELGPVEITSEAYRKVRYISSRVSELSGTPMEVSFIPLDYKGNGSSVVREVYLPKKQKVTPSSCLITSSITDLHELKNDPDWKIIGWGHSHGGHNLYFSRPDREVIRSYVANPKNHNGSSYHYSVGLVFNDHEEAFKAAYGVEMGGEYHFIDDVEVRIVDEENGIPFDREAIDRKLAESILIEGRPLEDLVEKPDYKTRYEDLLAEYNKETARLRQAISRLREEKGSLLERLVEEAVPVETALYDRLGTSYRQNLETYKDLYDIKPGSGAVDDVVEVISGSYKKDGKRLWTWESRVSEVESILEGEMTSLDVKKAVDLMNVISTNKYLAKKHPEKLSKLYMALAKRTVKKKGGKDAKKRAGSDKAAKKRRANKSG